MATRKAITLVSGLFQEVNTPTDKLDFAGNTTADLAENTNLYFTNERAQDAVGGMFTGNTETGITVTYNDGDGTVDFAISNTDSITEGSSNLYFTNARADARIAASSIAALSDVGSLGSPSAGQILAFDGSGNLQVANNSTTTDSTSEGTNKYFTDDRVNDVIVAGNGPVSYTHLTLPTSDLV